MIESNEKTRWKNPQKTRLLVYIPVEAFVITALAEALVEPQESFSFRWKTFPSALKTALF